MSSKSFQNATKLNGIVGISVLQFGATGDGVTDDRAAIQAALDSNYCIEFPPGTYAISDALTVNGVSKKLFSLANATIKRTSGSAATSLLYVSNNGTVEVDGITFDGTKSTNSNPLHLVNVYQSSYSKFTNCIFQNAKAVGATYGSGLIFTGNLVSAASHSVESCRFTGNDTCGLQAFQVQNLLIDDNYVHANQNGIRIDNMDLTFTQKNRGVVISNNICDSNSGVGIVVANYIENNIEASPIYGFANLESSDVVISANTCRYNGTYGIIAQGERIAVIGNVCSFNSTSVAYAGGIGMSAAYSVCTGNSSQNNIAYGIDAGGSTNCIISSNAVNNNTTVGINVGGTQNCIVSENNLFSNPVQIYVQNWENDGTGKAFPSACDSLIIANNTISNSGAQEGIKVVDGVTNITIQNNRFLGSNAAAYLILVAKSAVVSGNSIPAYISRQISVNGSGQMFVPDVMESCFTDSTTTVQTLGFSSMEVIGLQGVAWIEVTNGGSGYTTPPIISFSGGGGGAGAAAQAFVRNGQVVGIHMTNYGSGYSSTPTVVFSYGSAAATAFVGVRLPDDRNLTVYAKQAQTFNRLSSYTYTNIENKSQTNTSLAARCAVQLKSLFGQWNNLFVS
jgi:parallel beta-helix repeat protein